MGVAVAGITTTLWGAAIPNTSTNKPEGATHAQLAERKYIQEQRERELRGKLKERVEADLRDRAQPAEIRRAADDLARQLVRRIP